ncbi:MAG TPA: isoprenylcysteine carboxylmethyltransferase family protein [Flavobacteriaceae bacterium]|nr:isoprenylcysteine carboxylmethyltransferase family protein [Flavobacteriaceae bacterium]
MKPVIEKKKGPLPTPGSLLTWGVPLFFLLTQLGEISTNYFALQIIGLTLSFYHLIMNIWAVRTMGKHFVPGSGVFQNQKLVTNGPFRFMRHPIYSAHIALWLGTALATSNWILLITWPLYVAIMYFGPVREEEKLLNTKFGATFQKYCENTGKIFFKIKQ